MRERAGLPARGAVNSEGARGVSFWVLAPPAPLTHHVVRHLIPVAELRRERAREVVVAQILGRGEAGGGMVIMGGESTGGRGDGQIGPGWLGD